MTFIYCQQFFREGVSSGSISSTHHSWPAVAHQHHHLSSLWEQGQHSWAYCWSAGSPLQLLAQTGKKHPWQELRPHRILWLCSKCLPCGKSSAEVLYPLYWGSSSSCHRIQLLPVCIIFPVQLLFFTPACGFSLNHISCCKFG